MKDKIIEIISSYFDNYVGLRDGHRAIWLSDLPKMAAEIEAALIWHGPEVVPPKGIWKNESITVWNQSKENIGYDFDSNEWFNVDNPNREAHVEKWRYADPEPIKK